jgi:hypothetical protein
MNIININATNTTPAIKYSEDGRLLIKGRSINEGGVNFYQPLIDWAETLQIKMLIVDINLEYVNSTSSKKLLSLLKVLDANNNIKKLLVNWFYDEGDEDAQEKGQVMESFLHKAEFRYHKNSNVA